MQDLYLLCSSVTVGAQMLVFCSLISSFRRFSNILVFSAVVCVQAQIPGLGDTTCPLTPPPCPSTTTTSRPIWHTWTPCCHPIYRSLLSLYGWLASLWSCMSFRVGTTKAPLCATWSCGISRHYNFTQREISAFSESDKPIAPVCVHVCVCETQEAKESKLCPPPSCRDRSLEIHPVTFCVISFTC